MKDFLKKQNQTIDVMNRESGMGYKDYLDYLEANIGDDAEFTTAEMKALLKPASDKKT